MHSAYAYLLHAKFVRRCLSTMRSVVSIQAETERRDVSVCSSYGNLIGSHMRSVDVSLLMIAVISKSRQFLRCAFSFISLDRMGRLKLESLHFINR